MGNKWCFNNKNDFSTIEQGTTGVRPTTQNGQFKGFKFINFRAHKK